MYYKEIIKKDFNFKKVKKLYGILKNIKICCGNFRISDETGRFHLESCSFLMLMSLCGLKGDVIITIEHPNKFTIKDFSKKIEEI